MGWLAIPILLGEVMKKENAAACCEMCVNYVFDEEDECYSCLVNLDEDEYMRFASSREFYCPYFRLDDEYGVVRHQI